MKLVYAHHVEPHARDEDRAVIVRVSWGVIACVIDGAGGMPGGREAADACVDHVTAHADQLTGTAAIERALLDLDARCERDARIGEAAVVIVAVRDDGAVFGASCGDCEAWSIDADVVALTAGQHKKRRVGSGRASPVAFTATCVGTLVIGSDGLFGYAIREQIVAATRAAQPDEIVRALVAAAKGPPVALADDLAVAVVLRA